MNGLVLQCGGPSAVVNASLAAVIDAWGAARPGRLFGGCHGLRSLTTGDWHDLTSLPVDADRLAMQGGAALGSGRDRLDGEDAARALATLARGDIEVLLLIGGNGSMAACRAIAAAARAARYHAHGRPLRVIAIPKTIDNDMPGTHVCPGYGSAARFIVHSVHDASLDQLGMRGFEDVVLIEVMGRHTGWLAAASALARWNAHAPPHVILLPEVLFDEEGFVEAVRAHHAAHDLCVVVAAEGVKRDGAFLTEVTPAAKVERDASGQRLFTRAGGPLPYLAHLLQSRLRLRTRQVRPDVMQRSSAGLASGVDRDLAKLVGAGAVRAALAGEDGVLIAVSYQDGRWDTSAKPLGSVDAAERPLPPEFIDAGRLSVTPAFEDYLRPIIGDWNPAAILFERCP